MVQDLKISFKTQLTLWRRYRVWQSGVHDGSVVGLEVERTVVSGQTPEHWTVLLAGSGEEGVEGVEEGEAGRE